MRQAVVAEPDTDRAVLHSWPGRGIGAKKPLTGV
jgi:hypothetical protein